MIYSKPPVADAAQVLAYLGQSTHKTAVGNHRLIDLDGERMRLRWHGYADGNRRKVMRVYIDEFIRRFHLHVPPRGFTRPRHQGSLANRSRTRFMDAWRNLHVRQSAARAGRYAFRP